MLTAAKYSEETSKLALLYQEGQEDLKFNDRVTVVIVTYNKYAYVKELIKSFNYLKYDRSLLDIVVVDNASEDGTEEKLKEDFGDSITVVQTGANLGGAGGFNTGMKYAIENLDNDYIWLLDNDVIIHNNSLNNLLATIKSDEERIAAVGSMILQLDNPELVSEIGATMDWSKGKINMQCSGEKYENIHDKSARKLDYCPACSLLKTRKSIEKVGYWEDIFIHFDDVDWCLRAQEKGMEIYCNPKSIAFHESMNLKQATWIKYYNIRNLLYLYQNHKASLVPFALAKFSAWALYFLVHGFNKNAGLSIKAITDFLRGKKAKQDFPLESYQSFDSYNWDLIAKHRKIAMVFYNYENFEVFINKLSESNSLPEKMELIIYELSSEERSELKRKYPGIKLYAPKSKGIISMIKLGLKQFITTNYFVTIGCKKKIIFDGIFERYFMFPSFNKNIFIYTLYKSLVDKRGEN